MITRINQLPETECDEYCSVKMKSLFRAYGTKYDFCQFYEQTENGDTAAYIVKFYSSATVFVKQQENLEELCGFLNTIGVSEITSNIQLELNVKAKKFLQLKLSMNSCDGCDLNPKFDDYKLAHNLFSSDKSGNINVGDFDDWYVDLSHRVRHNAAYIFVDISTAAVYLTDGKNLILNGIVAANKNKGYGTKLIEKIKNSSRENIVFVACNEETMPFYLKNGFKPNGNVYVYGV